MKEIKELTLDGRLESNLKELICPKDTVEGTAMVFNFKNNWHGRLFLAMLRKALNRSVYSIRVRGSNADRVSLRKRGIYVSDQSVPLKYADRFRVYIDGIKFNQDAETHYHKRTSEYYKQEIYKLTNQLNLIVDANDQANKRIHNIVNS
jgi:hypothetical protein